MTSKKSTAIVLLVIIISAVILLFTTGKQSGNIESKIIPPIMVGAIIPQTGDVATYGDSLKKGFDLAAAEYKGKVEIIYEDSKASPKDGITAMQKLLGQGVKHFLGDATSGVNLALAPLANQNKAILMISIATSDDLSKAGPYIFRNCPPNSKQAESAANFIKDQLKVRKVAILAKANPYGANLAAQFRLDAASRGFQIVLDDQYDASIRNFSTIVQKLKNANPQVVFIPGNYEETAMILRKARELGFTAPFVGTDGAYSPKLMELAGQAAEGFYLTMLGVNNKTPFYQHLASAYEVKYGGTPDVFTSYGYEGAMILFQTIASGGTVSEQQQRLVSGSWDGLLGKTSFDENGEILRDIQILTVRNNEFVQYEK